LRKKWARRDIQTLRAHVTIIIRFRLEQHEDPRPFQD
jgi:hypothetical protein